MSAKIILFPGLTKPLPDSYFGGCPDCGKNDGYTNIHRDHWFFCRKHDVKWWVGTNLFSTWMDQDESEWREAEEWLSGYTVVEPIYASPGGTEDSDGSPF